MKRTLQLLLAVAALGLALNAGAAVILSYPFTSGTLNPTTTSFASGTAIANSGPTALTTFTTATTGGNTGGANDGYLQTAGWSGSGSTYISFTVTPTTPMTLTSITLDTKRSGGANTFNALNYQVLNGATTVDSGSGAVTVDSNWGSFSVATGSTTLAQGNTYTFRLWLSGDTSGAQANLDNIAVNAVPEPTNIALALFALGGTGFYAGRRFFKKS